MCITLCVFYLSQVSLKTRFNKRNTTNKNTNPIYTNAIWYEREEDDKIEEEGRPHMRGKGKEGEGMRGEEKEGACSHEVHTVKTKI